MTPINKAKLKPLETPLWRVAGTLREQMQAMGQGIASLIPSLMRDTVRVGV